MGNEILPRFNEKEYRIEEIDFNQIPKDMIKDSLRYRLVHIKKSKYFGVFFKKEIIGFCSILYYKNSVSFRNDYLLKKFRSLNIHNKMIEYRVEIIRRESLKKINVCCNKYSLKNYINFGFRIRKIRIDNHIDLIYEVL